MADHPWYSICAKCGIVHRKRDMRPIYSASSSSMPPHLLCYLCQNCYYTILDEWEIAEGV